ncbi:hypothetical protein [Amnibacterium kyonggiense]|uniref:Uncharacterized protein n=1 Tax=Amnibacterium kyonggiense TaxID=595671 RepID=A0A4R7FHN3_9MICO|nr:hypothetical protein [Amnibacterium kyonggiense]TDS75804.1 hypothetical protein CLV52_2913 [Amnibacterium kyonggiense]
MRAAFDGFAQQEPRSGWDPGWSDLRSSTPDAESNRRLARALVIVRNTDARSIAGFCAVIAVDVGLFVLAATVPRFPVVVAVFLTACAVLGLIGGAARDIRTRRESVSRTRPVGVPWSIRIGPTMIWVQSPSSVLVLPYAAFVGVRVSSGFTLLRLRDRHGYISLSSSMFPPGAINWVTGAVSERIGGPAAYRFPLQQPASGTDPS